MKNKKMIFFYALAFICFLANAVGMGPIFMILGAVFFFIGITQYDKNLKEDGPQKTSSKNNNAAWIILGLTLATIGGLFAYYFL